ncbi:hypothetical protein IT575_04655 [bacterium]|nr:hypothetical protein [bacterium]
MRTLVTVAILLLALFAAACSAGFDERSVSEGSMIDPNGGKTGASRGTMDPNGKTASLRAEWMD